MTLKKAVHHDDAKEAEHAKHDVHSHDTHKSTKRAPHPPFDIAERTATMIKHIEDMPAGQVVLQYTRDELVHVLLPALKAFASHK